MLYIKKHKREKFMFTWFQKPLVFTWHVNEPYDFLIDLGLDDYDHLKLYYSLLDKKNSI